MTPPTNRQLAVHSDALATVYLSVSWQPDHGKTLGYQLVRQLDSQGVLVVGDVKGLATMDPSRLTRIMNGCNGFVSVLPFRPDKPLRTSEFMVKEIEQAVSCNLPIAILFDNRINITATKINDAVEIVFADSTQLTIPLGLIKALKPYDFGVPKVEAIRIAELTDFVSELPSYAPKILPYAFLITRLQGDFELPRRACTAAVESTAGVRCLWVDSKSYRLDIDDTIERAKTLIEHCQFVVAELSIADEGAMLDNPSRAHEIGLATAFGKHVFVVSREPRRAPYHGLVTRSLEWWADESELFEKLCRILHSARGDVGRHVYNWELAKIDPCQPPKLVPPSFNANGARSWSPPQNQQLPTWLSWVYAVSFGVLVCCLAILVKRFASFDGTLDLVAILAGLTVFFSAGLHEQLYRLLKTVRLFQWLVPLVAALVLFATVITAGPKTEQGVPTVTAPAR